MAKQLVSPVERHVEKVILGIVGVVLLAVIARYLVTSPNQIELGGEMVSPNVIDEKAAEKAAVVRQRIRNATPPEIEVDALYPELVAALDPFGSANLAEEAPVAVTFAPEVPKVDRGEIRAGEKKLVEVSPLPKPMVKHGRSTFRNPLSDMGEWLPPADWVTVSAVFDVKEQMERQMHEYGPTRNEVIFANVDLQRRARRDDGSWSEDDWSSVSTWPAADVPAEPAVELVKEEGQWVLPREARTALERFLNELRDPKNQFQVVRPFPPEVRDGTPWEVPIITSRREVLLQNWDINFPGQAPQEPLEDPYPDLGEVQVEETPEQLTPREIIESLLEESQRYIELAQRNRSQEYATKAYNRAFEVANNREASRRDKTRAQRLMQRAEELEADFKRQQSRPGAQPGTDDSSDDDARRERLPKQQLWAHDARPGSIKNGRTYQYRMRVWLYNRLAGEPDKFADHRDAETVVIKGPWSESSDPVTIEPDTYYFVTSADQKKENVAVEFYKWFEGIWVKDRARLQVGAELKSATRCDVPALGGDGIEKPTVYFKADGTIVDIDYQRPYRERGRSGRDGVKFEARNPTCAVVLVDSEGRLHERLLPADKSHPAKATLSGRIWRAPRRQAGP
jgi:hypothetical protein